MRQILRKRVKTSGLSRTVAFLLILAVFPANRGFGQIDYDRDIRPIFSDTCFTCHGPDDAQRKADLRLDSREGVASQVVAGQPKKSELFRRITSHDSDERMPPPKAKRSLSAAQIAKIRAWIEQGAVWKGHWAFEPVTRPEIPSVKRADWVKNPIDAFVLTRLEAEGLEPSPPADSRVLARRLWLDLTGLPPRPQDADAFAKNPDCAATARRLFQTPAYAERMTYRWLDAARYADTSGYQSDGWRTMWRWRDWVIDAFARNLTFDQFTIEQLAGDLLPEPTLEQKIATGFNRNHRGNAEGGIVPEEFQVEYVVDRVDTTFAVWQGVTMGCARCHSHKYDPFTQREYYQLFAFFNRLPEHGRAFKEGNSAPWIPAPTPEQAKELKRLQAAEAAAKKRAAFEPENGWETGVEPRDWTITEGRVATSAQTGGEVAKFGYFDAFSFGARVKAGKGAEGTILSKMKPVDRAEGYNLHLTKRGTIQVNLVKRWLDDSVRVETSQPIPQGRWVHVFATYDGTRKAAGIRVYLDGKPAPLVANLDYINQSFATDEPLRVGAGMSPFGGEIREVGVFGRVLPASEVEVLAEAAKIPEILAKAPENRTPMQSRKLRQFYLREAGPEPVKTAFRQAILATRKRAEFQRAIPGVMIMEDGAERPTHVLSRGIYDQPGERVFPGVPASLPPLPPDAPRNRLGLARWLVSRENPLTARVTVNRLWRDFFGTGLVKTAEDFGVQGERPSHPELLDWLAAEFVENGWDVRRLLSIIVSSNTYRQSSRSTPELNRRDPENRLLARGPRFRLPAEALRDQALFVSGLLHEKTGGPSVKPYQPEGLWTDIASDKIYTLSAGPDLYRRSLYTYWKRTVPPPMMMNFDSAGREMCEVAVRRTNTPLQALNLMNDVTFVEAARVLAQEILVESPKSPKTPKSPKSPREALDRVFRRILQRSPDPAEASLLLESLAAYQARYANDENAARSLISAGNSAAPANLEPARLAAWTMICTTLLNLDETVTKE